MALDRAAIKVERLQTLLNAVKNIIVGSDYVDDEDLNDLKNIIDMADECVAEIGDLIYMSTNENKSSILPDRR